MLRLPGERSVVISHYYLRREQGKGTCSLKRGTGVVPGEHMGWGCGNEGEQKATGAWKWREAFPGAEFLCYVTTRVNTYLIIQ